MYPTPDSEWIEYMKFSRTDVIIYDCEQYFLIALYFLLTVILIVNTWQILIKQKKYKTLPLLNFYLFAWVGIPLRLINTCWFWGDNIRLKYNLPYIQIFSKLCLGVV